MTQAGLGWGSDAQFGNNLNCLGYNRAATTNYTLANKLE
jgi:hypothetical protein